MSGIASTVRGDQCIALAREDAVDRIVFPAARLSNEIAQLIGVADQLRRALASLGRVRMKHAVGQGLTRAAGESGGESILVLAGEDHRVRAVRDGRGLVLGWRGSSGGR